MTEQNNDGAGLMDRWSVVHQACYEAIRACQQDEPAGRAKVLWQIISPAVCQVFRNIRVSEPGKQPSGNNSRIGEVLWMVIEQDVYEHFLKITEDKDFKYSVLECFTAVCKAIPIVTYLEQDVYNRIKEQMNLISQSDKYVQQAVSGLAHLQR